MATEELKIGKLFTRGWEYTKSNLGFLLVYQIILYLLVLAFSSEHHGFFWTLVGIAAWVIIVLAKMGLYNSALLITQNIKPKFTQFYENWQLFLSWVIANFLYGLMVVIGLVLLIVPGLYLLSKYALFPFFILDKQLGPIEALKRAGEASRGVRWPLFVLILACIGLNILGFLLLGVGLLLSVPVTLFALALAYRQLTDRVIILDKTNIDKTE